MANVAASRVALMAMVGKDRNQKIVVDPYLPLIPILTSHILLQEESPEVNRLLQGSLIVNVRRLPLFRHQMIIILIVIFVRLPLAMIIIIIIVIVTVSHHQINHKYLL